MKFSSELPSGAFFVANLDGFAKRQNRLSGRDPRRIFYTAMQVASSYEQYFGWVGSLRVVPVGRKERSFSGQQEIMYARKRGWITDV